MYEPRELPGLGVVTTPAIGARRSKARTSSCSSAYLATGVGGLRYPLTLQQRRSLLSLLTLTLTGPKAHISQLGLGGACIGYFGVRARFCRLRLQRQIPQLG